MGGTGRRTMLMQVSALVGGNLTATAVRMVSGFLTARCVEPAVMGLFSGIGLVQGYIPGLQLGILNGLSRELPYYVGKGEQERVRDLAAAAQAWALLLGSVVSLTLAGVAIWYAVLGRWAFAVGWLTNAVSAFALFYGTFYLQITYRTRGDFARLALNDVIQSIATLVLVVVVWWLAFYGLCLRTVLVALLQLMLLWHWRPVRVRSKWSRKQLLHLLKVGAPIFVVGQGYTYWGTLDSTLMLWYCGSRGLGLYALANMASAAMQILPGAVIGVLYPQMAEEYGRSGNLHVLAKSTVRPMAMSLLIVLPLTVAGWFLVPPVIRALLPKYVDAIPVVQWALFMAPVMCFGPVNNVFNVIKRQDLYAVTIFAGMVAYYGCLRWLLRNGPELTAFPKAMVAGKIVFMLSCYVALAWLLHNNKNRTHIAAQR